MRCTDQAACRLGIDFWKLLLGSPAVDLTWGQAPDMLYSPPMCAAQQSQKAVSAYL